MTDAGAPTDGATRQAAEPAAATRVSVELIDGLRGLAPGQSLVLYDGTRVLGQATVASGVRGRMAS